MALVPFREEPHARVKYRPPSRIPAKTTLTKRALRTLLQIMEDTSEFSHTASRVGAAKVILEYATTDPVAEALSMLQGGDNQAIQFLEQKLQYLKQRQSPSSEVRDAEFAESEPVRR